MSDAIAQQPSGLVPVLMYHSISKGASPTCIAPQEFRMQMDILEQAGYSVVPLPRFGEWTRGNAELPPKSAVLTFDDGFLDFATTAFPELERRRWPATVFLPTAHVGGTDSWDSAPSRTSARRLMDWSTVENLSAMGVEFGAHSATHVDLTRLEGDDLTAEILRPKTLFEERLGRPVTSFAAPFGRSNGLVESIVRQAYRQAVGTELAVASGQTDPYRVPRIEMWYFRDRTRWTALLRGEATMFLWARRQLRRLRAKLTVNTHRPDLVGSRS
jgi:peptidoglycan/xylan/chitin deacetylase (PgdA/CDA1 family)